MFEAVSRVSTDKASRYLAQLCKHFAHKVSVEWSEDKGEVDFGMGRCDLEASRGELRIGCIRLLKKSIRDPGGARMESGR